jgi:hypothetical protein
MQLLLRNRKCGSLPVDALSRFIPGTISFLRLSTHSDLRPFIEYSPFLTAPHEAVQVP